MKLGSKVGIIFSVLLIITGIVLCSMAKREAKDYGQSLFMEVEDGKTYFSQIIPEKINKITIRCSKTKLSVRNTDEESRIELINFNPNLYNVSTNSNTISVDETTSITSFESIWENGITFKGLRYLLDTRNLDFNEDEKEIIVYINKDNSLNKLSFEGMKAEVNITDIKLKGDIILKVDDAKIDIKNLSTESGVSATSKTVDLSIDKSDLGSFKVSSVNGTVYVLDNRIGNADIQFAATGHIKYDSPISKDFASIKVSADSGSLKINGADSEKTFTNELEKPEYEFIIKVVSGDIEISKLN